MVQMVPEGDGVNGLVDLDIVGDVLFCDGGHVGMVVKSVALV